MECVVQQVERMEIVDEEEVVESLGKVEQEMDFKLENTSTPSGVVDDFVEVVKISSIELEDDVQEDNAQPPKHSMNDERVEEVDQEASSTNEECVEDVGEQETEIEEVCQEVEKFRFSENAKMDQVKTSMKNGVLTITVSKAEVKKPNVKPIQITR
ncbi:18.1 kDa class I heat shock protein-like [Arachis stenosperma]|uniref:18.1 kDa class I heat shock protein-like n=1 Tax=Arachis stenosperma TaxID=217475 RepID=UPI0025AC7F1B|nr:18.1 kDa class I heat shock protein-like [Arachis stenosperma]